MRLTQMCALCSAFFLADDDHHHHHDNRPYNDDGMDDDQHDGTGDDADMAMRYDGSLTGRPPDEDHKWKDHDWRDHGDELGYPLVTDANG